MQPWRGTDWILSDWVAWRRGRWGTTFAVVSRSISLARHQIGYALVFSKRAWNTKPKKFRRTCAAKMEVVSLGS